MADKPGRRATTGAALAARYFVDQGSAILQVALGTQRIVACGLGLTNTDLVAETFPKGMDQVLK